MSVGSSTGTSRQRDTLCRYFMSNACRLGDNCSFSHSWSNRPSNTCKFYQSGSCNYGTRCRSTGTSRQRDTLCRYFMSNACRLGDNCSFSHSWSNRPSNTCKFYQSGSCNYGTRCRYDHDRRSCTERRNVENNEPAVVPTPKSLKPIPRLPQIGGSGSFPTSATDASNTTSTTAIELSPLPTSSCPAIATPSPPLLRASPTDFLETLLSEHNSSYSDDEDAYPARPMFQSTPSTVAAIDASVSSLRADAPEFVPEAAYIMCSYDELQPEEDATPVINTYADAVTGGESSQQIISSDGLVPLCSYFVKGECWYGDECIFAHGNLCEYCGEYCLHPDDTLFNTKHRNECMKLIEDEMEESFAIQRSKEKTCGICMETVLDKKASSSGESSSSTQRFGILQNCKHCFCLDCIRKWRQSTTFENKIVRSCPECRVSSDFVTPSAIWVEDAIEKQNLINVYKNAMKAKCCRYFKKGEAECPFGNRCFYLHSKPDGTVVHGDSPKTVQRRIRAANPNAGRRRRTSSSSSNNDFLREYLLWHYMEEREAMRSGGGSGIDLFDSLSDDGWSLELEFDLGLDSDTDSDDYWD